MQREGPGKIAKLRNLSLFRNNPLRISLRDSINVVHIDSQSKNSARFSAINNEPKLNNTVANMSYRSVPSINMNPPRFAKSAASQLSDKKRDYSDRYEAGSN